MIGKGKALRKLLDRFPRRKFILVGDAKEDYPAIYAGVAKDPKYASQILRIAIRLVSRKDNLGEQQDKCATEFRDLNPSIWTVFEREGELNHNLENFAESAA
jgi:phosphatidate phosphatase APP1